MERFSDGVAAGSAVPLAGVAVAAPKPKVIIVTSPPLTISRLVTSSLASPCVLLIT